MTMGWSHIIKTEAQTAQEPFRLGVGVRTVLDPFTLAAQRYFAPPESADPVGWATGKGIHLWSKQREILESIRDNRYTAVHSCHDSGKSFSMAVASGNHLETNQVGDAFLVSTAPSVAQVDAILWREIRKFKRKANLRGRIIGGGYPQWMVGDELIGYGRKPQDYDQTAFQGIHAPKVMVVIDEADGVPKDLFDAADALATNELARVVAIGNPDNPESHFHTVCQPGSGWNVIHIDGLQTPRFNQQALDQHPELAELFAAEGLEPVDEPVPEELRLGLLSPIWVVERLKSWSTNSALWSSKVRGLFPGETSQRVVIPLGWVEAAIQRWHDWVLRGRPEVAGARILGVDVAEEGSDESAYSIRTGNVFHEVVRSGLSDPIEFADLIDPLFRYPGASGCIDVIGPGGRVYGVLYERGLSVAAFRAGAPTDLKEMTGTYGFADERSAAWWRLREALDPIRNSQICLPPDEKMKADLTAPHYLVQGNKIKVEGKPSIAKRLKRSTDTGDAIVMNWWLGGSGAEIGTSLTGLVSGWTNEPSPLAAEWDRSHWESSRGSEVAPVTARGW